ncbi:MAG: hypothetical protein HRU38_03925 [Saccharospirillaceae bacterium]|nr:hypothetical protein [Pseudomonadales bacterium]NRB77813.1 hypothetical protein [Saccharospirillaceae bacterium]
MLKILKLTFLLLMYSCSSPDNHFVSIEKSIQYNVEFDDKNKILEINIDIADGYALLENEFSLTINNDKVTDFKVESSQPISNGDDFFGVATNLYKGHVKLVYPYSSDKIYEMSLSLQTSFQQQVFFDLPRIILFDRGVINNFESINKTTIKQKNTLDFSYTFDSKNEQIIIQWQGDKNEKIFLNDFSFGFNGLPVPKQVIDFKGANSIGPNYINADKELAYFEEKMTTTIPVYKTKLGDLFVTYSYCPKGLECNVLINNKFVCLSNKKCIDKKFNVFMLKFEMGSSSDLELKEYNQTRDLLFKEHLSQIKNDEIEKNKWINYLNIDFDTYIKGNRVFLAVDAQWSIDSQVNKKIAMTESFYKLSKSENVKLVAADHTYFYANTQNLLERYNRTEVPLYILFIPGYEPYIFPNKLGENTLIDMMLKIPN